MHDALGIDISKAHLDCHCLATGRYARFENDKSGLIAITSWVGTEPHRLIYEATGRYGRDLEAHFFQTDQIMVKVNPMRARRFAQAIGQDAKTDRLDAAFLARMGATLDLQETKVNTESMNDLRELQTARLALIKDQTACRNRLAIARNKLVLSQLKARLRQIDGQVSRIDAEFQRRIKEDKTMFRNYEILLSIPAIGPVAAMAILLEMPEIGTMSSKQVGSLAGLAPVVRQSGKWVGAAHIKGGRRQLRRALYMPAVVAIRHNPQMKQIYDKLRASGKPPKVALVAIMRKLIVLANTLIHENRKWSENRP